MRSILRGIGYWHQVDAYAKLIAQRERAVPLRMPSLGAISSGLRVQYIWGVPRSAHYLGRTMDIGHSIVGVQGMDSAAFQRELGLRTSYLEGNIFDQVFGRETGTGISAVRLIQTAQESGQRVFTLNSGNADQHLGQIQMSAIVREEILDALLMGLEVTVPEFTQDINGWQGTGYIAIRPETGAGAYIISGSLRGGDEGGDCDLKPSTEPAKTTNFSPAVLFAAAIISMYLIASITPVIVVVGVSLLAVSASAVAAPAPQLGERGGRVWDRLSGGRGWPTQFNWPPSGSYLDRGLCSEQQHAALVEAKKLACKQDPLADKPCRDGDSCTEIDAKRNAKIKCIEARPEEMNTCFQGGDQGHWQQISDKLNAIGECDKCLAREQANQCRAP